MLLKKIRAKNYKTYLDLEVNLETTPDQPIVLIGGANGGGKTTFFDAIYGALYGLNIRNEQEFKELLNAGALGKVEERIELELHFSGLVLSQEQSYVLTRTYMLNTSKQPVESVKLNMNGTIFQYGSATPESQRVKQEAQVNKIIKANLPEELSRYFLFDAMEAGNLLEKDMLNRVIKENIENVMGFNRYLSLSKASESLTEDYKAQLLDQENEKEEYQKLLEKKREQEEMLKDLKGQWRDALKFSVKNKEVYDKLRKGFDEETTLNKKIEELEKELKELEQEEKQYKTDMSDFIQNFELSVTIPKLSEVLKRDIELILSEREESGISELSHLTKESIENVLVKALTLLTEKGKNMADVSVSEIAERIIEKLNDEADSLKYDYFEPTEIDALNELISSRYQNPYPSLKNRRQNLDTKIKDAKKTEVQIKELRGQATGDDYSLITKYEENEKLIKQLEETINLQDKEILKITEKLQNYDIQTTEEPDPKFELLKKLSPLFNEITNTLLTKKKSKIEERMKQDLNINLAAYEGVVDRVELSEDLKDLSFRIFHKSGNEIYLNQLNTASMQVVVQVLLKALHEFGDYNPPVMIDTVMGVLDKTSRSKVLENYFPSLSHQTILLSSDSEIDPDSDLEKIEPFVSKAFTLVRDKEQQKTSVKEGYFNQQI